VGGMTIDDTIRRMLESGAGHHKPELQRMPWALDSLSVITDTENVRFSKTHPRFGKSTWDHSLSLPPDCRGLSSSSGEPSVFDAVLTNRKNLSRIVALRKRGKLGVPPMTDKEGDPRHHLLVILGMAQRPPGKPNWSIAGVKGEDTILLSVAIVYKFKYFC